MSNTQLQLKMQSQIQSFESQYEQELNTLINTYETLTSGDLATYTSENNTLTEYVSNQADAKVIYNTAMINYKNLSSINLKVYDANNFVNNALALTTTAVTNAVTIATNATAAAVAIEKALASIAQLASDVGAVSAMIRAEDEGSEMSGYASEAKTASTKATQAAELASMSSLNITIQASQSPLANAAASITETQTDLVALQAAITGTLGDCATNISNTYTGYTTASTAAVAEVLINSGDNAALKASEGVLKDVQKYNPLEQKHAAKALAK